MAEVPNPTVGTNVANSTVGATTANPSIMASLANTGGNFAQAIVNTIGIGAAATNHAVQIVGKAEEQASKIAMSAVNSTGKIGVAAINTGTKLTTNTLHVVSSASNSSKRIANAALTTGASVVESTGKATTRIANAALTTGASVLESTGTATSRIVNSTGKASARIANSALNTGAKLINSSGKATVRIANSALNTGAALVESTGNATKQGVGEVIAQAGKVTQSVGRLAGVTTAAVSDMLTRFANAASKSTRNAISTNAANNKLRNMNPQHFRNALIRDYKLILANTITEFGKLFKEYNTSFENYIKVYQSTFCKPGWFWGHSCTSEIVQKIKTFKDNIKQIGGKFKFNMTKISSSVGFYGAAINRLVGLNESEMMNKAQEITKANFDEFEKLLREITNAFDILFSTIEKATTTPIISNAAPAGGYTRRTRARRNRRTRKIRSYN